MTRLEPVSPSIRHSRIVNPHRGLSIGNPENDKGGERLVRVNNGPQTCMGLICKMAVKRQLSLLSREGTVARLAIYARPTNDYEKMVEVLWQTTDPQMTHALC